MTTRISMDAIAHVFENQRDEWSKLVQKQARTEQDREEILSDAFYKLIEMTAAGELELDDSEDALARFVNAYIRKRILEYYGGKSSFSPDNTTSSLDSLEDEAVEEMSGTDLDTPELLLEADSMWRTVYWILDKYPPDKALFIQDLIYGDSQAEVCSAYDINQPMVSKWWNRFKQDLEKELHNEE